MRCAQVDALWNASFFRNAYFFHCHRTATAQTQHSTFVAEQNSKHVGCDKKWDTEKSVVTSIFKSRRETSLNFWNSNVRWVFFPKNTLMWACNMLTWVHQTRDHNDESGCKNHLLQPPNHKMFAQALLHRGSCASVLWVLVGWRWTHIQLDHQQDNGGHKTQNNDPMQELNWGQEGAHDGQADCLWWNTFFAKAWQVQCGSEHSMRSRKNAWHLFLCPQKFPSIFVCLLHPKHPFSQCASRCGHVDLLCKMHNQLMPFDSVDQWILRTHPSCWHQSCLLIGCPKFHWGKASFNSIVSWQCSWGGRLASQSSNLFFLDEPSQCSASKIWDALQNLGGFWWHAQLLNMNAANLAWALLGHTVRWMAKRIKSLPLPCSTVVCSFPWWQNCLHNNWFWLANADWTRLN